MPLPRFFRFLPCLPLALAAAWLPAPAADETGAGVRTATSSLPDDATTADNADAVGDRTLPKARPRLKDNEVVSLARRLEVHGEASLTFGWAKGGGNFRAASMYVEYYDPKTGISLGIGYANVKGNGFFGYPYDYDYAFDPALGGWGGASFARASLRSRGGIFAPGPRPRGLLEAYATQGDERR